MSRQPAILFVCLGNICRSPLAEAALRLAAEEAGLSLIIDSAGTGNWHVGRPPDRRAQVIALRNGVDIGHMRARQIGEADFRNFTHILALDHDNLAMIEARAPHDATAQIALLLDFVPGREGEAVADPYYGDESGFEMTWNEVTEAAREVLAHLSR